MCVFFAIAAVVCNMGLIIFVAMTEVVPVSHCGYESGLLSCVLLDCCWLGSVPLTL